MLLPMLSSDFVPNDGLQAPLALTNAYEFRGHSHVSAVFVGLTAGGSHCELLTLVSHYLLFCSALKKSWGI